MNKQKINAIAQKFGFEIHGTGYIQSLKKQSFKEDVFAIQKAAFETASIIFDIGANRGDTVAAYKEQFPNAKIYAFEPFPDSYDLLAERFKDDFRVKCYNIAISNTVGPTLLYVNQNVDTNSLLKPTVTGLSSDKQVENKEQLVVQTLTLDMFCTQHAINHIDILKMDIQGGELAALKGATRLLTDKVIKLIFTETYFIKQYEQQPLFHDLSRYVYEYDFLLKDIYCPIYGNGRLSWADVIFILSK